MKIAILAAMGKELKLILNQMPDAEKFEIGGVTYHRGMIGGNEVIAGQCGIGKVNSALNTYRLIDALHPDLVINSGVAGGVGGRLGIGDVLIADRVAYHDVWCGPGTEPGAADGYPQFLLPSNVVLAKASELFANREDVHQGLICSGDKFISKAEEVAEIHANFPEAVAVDMESASIGQTCTMMGVPFAIVRVMSDTPGEAENISQYEGFWDKAPERTFTCVRALIENMTTI